jgi:hypothetical protein
MIVLILTLITLGTFGVIWLFVEAAFVRKIDRRNNALLLYSLFVVGWYGGSIYGYVVGVPGIEGFGALAGIIIDADRAFQHVEFVGNSLQSRRADRAEAERSADLLFRGVLLSVPLLAHTALEADGSAGLDRKRGSRYTTTGAAGITPQPESLTPRSPIKSHV